MEKKLAYDIYFIFICALCEIICCTVLLWAGVEFFDFLPSGLSVIMNFHGG
jgi:hypothetical protein